MAEIFQFKQFQVNQENCSMKVGTDGVLLGAWANVTDANQILDIGTGTGVIALMAAQKNLEASIVGIEIDPSAAQEAQINVANSSWHDKIQIVNQSIQDYANEANQKFDSIISNPPFFTGGTLSTSQDKTSVRHTVKLSHNALLSAVRTLLADTGKFSLILPYIEGLRFVEMAKTYNLYPNKITEVYPDQSKKLERLLISFGKKEVMDFTTDKIYIRDTITKDFSQAYQMMTKDFYLKF